MQTYVDPNGHFKPSILSVDITPASLPVSSIFASSTDESYELACNSLISLLAWVQLIIPKEVASPYTGLACTITCHSITKSILSCNVSR